MNRDHRLQLLDIVPFFTNATVCFNESISRSRNVGGHDRHFAVQSQFTMQVTSVNTSISGSRLEFFGDRDTWYGLSLESITAITFEEGRLLEIIERFEQETERKTRISILGQQ